MNLFQNIRDAIFDFILSIKISKFFQYLSDNYEQFVYLSCGILAMAFILSLSVSITEEITKKKRYVLKDSLRTLTIFGIIVLYSLAIFIYWVNYHFPADSSFFEKHLVYDTQWVKNETLIYYIKDNELKNIRINEDTPQTIFKDKYPIMEYVFSPNGRYMLIASSKNLYLLELVNKQTKLIDSIEVSGAGADSVQGVINGLRWAPNSEKFCYEISQWSQISSRNNIYFYDLVSEHKVSLPNPARKISSPYWDMDSKDLYYLKYESLDVTYSPYPYDIKVVKIYLDTLKSEVVAKIPADNLRIPIENLKIRDIKLFLDGGKLSFGRNEERQLIKSDRGSIIGIDKEDSLYYIKHGWFQKRLFKVKRKTDIFGDYRYKSKPGDLEIDNIVWAPGNRYILLHHRYYGVIVLDPVWVRIGLLTYEHGRAFGWYPN